MSSANWAACAGWANGVGRANAEALALALGVMTRDVVDGVVHGSR